jgi:hypothetical protein
MRTPTNSRSSKSGTRGRTAGPKKGQAPGAAGGGSTASEAGSEAGGDAVHAPKMKLPEVLAELEDAAKQVGIRVTYEAIGGELGAGGLCKVKGQWRAIIDKRTTASERASVLAAALARFPLDNISLSEQVRELVSRVISKPTAELSPDSPMPSPTADSPGFADAQAAAAPPAT